MSKDKLQLLSPLFLKYQSDFEKNPRSRVFAPLAETYRKLGMTDKAMEILSQGIRFHPTYVMGYLGLAFCYFDIKQFNLAYTTLRPLIENNRDNLRLQKLFADICLELGKDEEAVETFKYLLFINPRDKEVGEQVTRLEKKIEDRYRPTHQPIIIPESEISEKSELRENEKFDIEKLSVEPKYDFDDWMTVNLNSQEVKSIKPSTSSVPKNDNYDQWNVKKPEDVHEKSHEEYYKVVEVPKVPKEELRTYEVRLDFDDDQVTNEEKKLTAESLANTSHENSIPLVTHTLVDLYCGQGHIEKALEILEKIHLLNPNDQKTIDKIKEIKYLMKSDDNENKIIEEENIDVPEHIQSSHSNSQNLVKLEDLEDTSEEDGRRHLMSLIDEKISPIEIYEEQKVNPENNKVILEDKLNQFLKKIQKRALDYQNGLGN